MRTLHQTFAALAALLLAAAPAVAIDIAPSLLEVTSEAKRVPGTPLIEFDRDDWAAFLSDEDRAYRLPEFAAAKGATALPESRAGELIVTLVWEQR